jgi:multiple antibiotic resistance protein
VAQNGAAKLPAEWVMSAWDSQFNAFVTLLVTISPHSLAPLFLALTAGMNRKERNQVAVRSSIIGFVVLSIFALFGISILALFGITIPAFRVAGGLLLFYIAFEMIFERRQQRREQSTQTAITKDMIRNISAFPLAIPLIAGPGAISATILVADKLPGLADRAVILPAIAFSIIVTWATFVIAERLDAFLGETGRSILTRLLGILLAALSVQFVADGVKALAAG